MAEIARTILSTPCQRDQSFQNLIASDTTIGMAVRKRASAVPSGYLQRFYMHDAVGYGLLPSGSCEVEPEHRKATSSCTLLNVSRES